MMSELLENLSNGLAETVEAVNPAVVRVEARRRMPATGVVWSADGVIVTAHHIVERDENIQIGLADGSIVEASLVGRDPNTDLAVLRASTKELTAPSWSDLDGLRVGHLVLALGRAGSHIHATLGVVSAIGETGERRSHRRHGGELDRYIQTDVVMYPGFSGGPLVDAAGQVRGLNTSIMRGTSLAIPTSVITRVTEVLLTHGRIQRGYLGITSQPVALPVALKSQLQQETGLLVIAVEPDSPAEKGGLVLGDTLVALGGYTVSNLDDLMSLLVGERVGSSVPVKVLRGGELREVKVVIGERP
jgi:S1-C subfamily serine protease